MGTNCGHQGSLKKIGGIISNSVRGRELLGGTVSTIASSSSSGEQGLGGLGKKRPICDSRGELEESVSCSVHQEIQANEAIQQGSEVPRDNHKNPDRGVGQMRFSVNGRIALENGN